MKKVERYICERCHTEYAKQEDCKQCENNHKPVVEITAEKFVPYGADHSGYPLSVNIKMEDGRTITYKRS